jgi:ribonuclease P protein component
MHDDPPVRGPDQGFPPCHRLRRRREYLAVYDEGRRKHGRYVVLFALARCEGEAPWRVGLTTPRKLGKAVRRNRLRRIGREVFRRRREALPVGVDFVVNFKAPAVQAAYGDLERDLIDCLARLGYPPAGQPAAPPNAPPEPPPA